MNFLSRRKLLSIFSGMASFVSVAWYLASCGSQRETSHTSVEPEASQLLDSNTKHLPDGPPPPPPSENAVIGKYAAGIAQTVQSDTIVIANPSHGNIIVHRSPTTDFWEERWVNKFPIEVGDRVVVWGSKRSDGSYDAERLWSNPVNLVGIVKDKKQESDTLDINLTDRYLGDIKARFTPETLVAEPTDYEKTLLRGRQVSIRRGQGIQVIGRLKDGVVLATDVYID